MEENLKIKPYARLLTMLGDQLIKNEIVAISELIKNSYDADADNCIINFNGFNDDFVNNYNSSIIVSDDGFGMSYETITNHFLNPATSIKTNKDIKKSTKGRVYQGEKGIGRFSMLKLGKKVTIYSKELDNETVHKVVFDFSNYDEDFKFEKNIEKIIFLDEIVIKYDSLRIDSPELGRLIKEKNKGTEIVIEFIKGDWNNSKIEELKTEIIKFSPLEIINDSVMNDLDYRISIEKNGKEIRIYEEKIRKLQNLIKEKSVFKINGSYIEDLKRIDFNFIEANGKLKFDSIYLDERNNSKNSSTISIFGTSYFRNNIQKYFDSDGTTICGNFDFNFYIFDFSANQSDDFGLTKEDKEIIRSHRVFLYRDNIRVQPYGSSNDDWLQIDRSRAAVRASEMFSNDQLVGQIRITKDGNIRLRDKTSREGIIEDTKAFEQLINITRAFLSFIRTTMYQNRNKRIEKKSKQNDRNYYKNIDDELKKIKDLSKNNEKLVEKITNVESYLKNYESKKNNQIQTVESLAGVGLSVEVSSHDIMLTLKNIRNKIQLLKEDFSSELLILSRIEIIKETLISTDEMIELVYSKMKDLQQLFVSSKQKQKNISVVTQLEKVANIYKDFYIKNGITIEIANFENNGFNVNTIESVLFQVFINLFDNALYWLKQDKNQRKVEITINAKNKTVRFSDNGPGISKFDAPFIFDAFYSGKGEEGRGLGLYIAKRLLRRYKFDIYLEKGEVLNNRIKASFIIDFNENLGEEND